MQSRLGLPTRLACLGTLLLLSCQNGPAGPRPNTGEKVEDSGGPRVLLETTVGPVVLAMDPKAAPATVAQFLKLAEAGVFDTTHFYSIHPGFLAQTSWAFDRRLPITAQQKAMLKRLPLEAKGPRHERGVLSMGRDDKNPGNGESSFCIMLGAAPQLDGKYTVFGRVESGMDVVAEIESAGSGNPTRPLRRIEITKASVYRDRAALSSRVASLASARKALAAAGPPAHPSPPTAEAEPAPSCHPAEQEAAHHPKGKPAVAAGAGTSAPKMSALDGTRRDGPVDIKDRVLASGELERTLLFQNLPIEGVYPSMHGPWTQRRFKLAPESSELWITSYRAEVLDGKTGRASQEFMCHTNLDLVGTPGAPPEYRGTRAQLSISQGQTELRFPPQFALRLDNGPHRQLNVTAMVLNSNYPKLKRSFDFRSSIRYLDGAVARRRGVIPLFQTSVYTTCPIDPPADPKDRVPTCKPATEWEVMNGASGRRETGHWMVPRGKHSITQDVTAQLGLQYDTTVHYIWVHLHPYGERMILRDKTTGKVIWEGRAKNHRRKAMLLSTTHFSSVKGIPLFKDHRYELTTIYNKPHARKATAMAALWMYLRSQDQATASAAIPAKRAM